MISDFSPLWISLKTAGLASIATFFLGIAAAYWVLGDRRRWKSLIESIFIAPLILPPTVVGFLLLLLFGKNGPLGQVMAAFDFSIVFTWYAAVITATVVAFPLMYKTALGAFEQVDRSLLQVAQTLGASRSDVFWRILLPLSVPGLLAGATLSFARALGEFGATLMLAGNIPGQTQTMPMAIYFAVEAGAMGEAWAWVLIILSISLSSIVAVNLWQKQHEQRRGQADSSGIPRNVGTSAAFSADQDQLFAEDRGIWLDIQANRANFTLKVAFSAQQETVGLLGASGSGKSMTLRCIAGIETPDQGKIVLNGQTLFDSRRGINIPSHRRSVGLVFQNYALFPHMTVAQNVAFGLRNLPPDVRSQRVSQQLAMVQLSELGDRYPHQLSGGQQQRVALARALATDPDILLLDEPFSALDTHLRNELEKQLIKILTDYKGITLFVSHNLEEAYRVCRRLLVLETGNVIANGHKQDVFDHPQTLSIAQLTGCKNYSRIQPVDTQTVHALDWNCTLQTTEPVSSKHTQIGIRAHHIRFPLYPETANTLPGWLTWTSETPHRMTVFLKLGDAPCHAEDYHLQAEVFKDEWESLKDRPQPWHVALDSRRLLLLQ
jgi:molybdate ABC transporter permease protein